MGKWLSASKRATYLQEMCASEMDLLVIGGGITGAGIAWDASVRGMKVGLLEMNDFASGASSRSTKRLISGIRDLMQGEVKHVRELARERALIHQRVPHIVTPLPVLFPIYKNRTHGYCWSSIGIYIYDWLAGVKRSKRSKMFNRHKTMKREPLLKEDGLKGAAHYYEYRTDDARLTIEILKTARSHGAQLCNYAKVVDFLYKKGKVAGVEVEDTLSGQKYRMNAKKIVNAAGAWIDHLRELDHSLHDQRLMLTKSVHLVVDYKRLPIQQAAYFTMPNGRMMFAIPRDGKTYIGTKDIAYEGEPLHPDIMDDDVNELLEAVNDRLPTVGLKRKHIESGWVGLHPHMQEKGRRLSVGSRKEAILKSDTGLISIVGGTLTDFRKRAEKVVDLVAERLEEETGVVYPPCTTDRVAISGGETLDGKSYEAVKSKLVDDGVRFGLSTELVLDVMSRYGTNTESILHDYRELSGGNYTQEEQLLYAEILYSVRHEMTTRAVDFLLRRTSWLLFDRQRAERLSGKVIAYLGEQLEWDEKRIAEEWTLVKRQLAQGTFVA